jgi:hypothetical protein
MPDPTNADRQRRWRQRQAGELSPTVVCSCGKRALGDHGGLCSRCWLKTAEGREWQRLRMQAFRRRAANYPESPDGSPS